MNKKLERLETALAEYPRYEVSFKKFRETFVKDFHNNEFLPGISIDESDVTAPILHFAGQTFIVRMHVYAVDEAPIGVIAVYRPRRIGDEELIWHSFFDSRGNVRQVPTSQNSERQLWEASFVKILLQEVATRHFGDLEKRFRPGLL